MMKRIAATSAVALILSAVVPLSASAQTDGSAWRTHGVPHRIAGQDADFGAPRDDFGYGFFLNAPSYPYVPQGGNSGGANFPHSGT
jgi:hypothetical protein